MQTVEPYLSRDVQTVPPTAQVSEMLDRFAGGSFRHLVVVDGGRLVGVVRSASVLAAAERPAATADDLLSGALVMSRTSRLVDVLEALCGDPEDIVVVVDDENRPVGVFTEHDGVRVGARQLPTTLLAGTVGVTEVATVTWDATLREAHQQMRNRDIRHLVVVGSDGPLGVLSERDLTRAGALRKPDQGIAGLLSEHTFRTASPDEPLAHLADAMYTQKIGSIPLLSEGALVGIVTRTDVIRALLDHGG